MYKRKARIEIGGVTFVSYFIYAAFIWLCEAFDLFCFLTGIPQATLISRLLIALVLCIVCISVKDSIYIRKGKKIDQVFVLGCMGIFGFCAFKGVIPDVSFDVKRYHLLAQNPGFVSMTKGPSFMPGNFQYYGFRWGDRMFYPFRMLLGYRMGTLFGGLISVLIYGQIYSLIAALYGEKLEAVRLRFGRIFRQSFFPGILFTEGALAFLITQIYDVLLQSGGYMVEMIGIPFALEAMHILLLKKEQKRQGEMVWYALLCGCFFAMKMTHVVYIVPMILVYLIKHRNYLTIKRFLTAFAVAVVPVGIYLVYSFADTGNPVFPYFNSLFKSPYFPLSDFRDTRWGPQNLLEMLVWPFLSVINPTYRSSEIPNENNLGMICLMAVIVVQVVRYIASPRNRKHGELLAVVIISAYLWSVTTGHVRYFIFGYILTGVLLVEFLVNSVFDDYRINGIISTLMLGIICVQLAYNMVSITGGREWAWRNNRDRGFLFQNMRLVFRDYTSNVDNGRIVDGDVSAFIVNQHTNGGIANLLCYGKPVINNDYLNNNISDATICAYWKDRINEYLDIGGVYEVLIPTYDELDWNSYIETLDRYGFAIKNVIWPQTIFVREHSVAFVELEKLQESKNQLYIANQNDSELLLPNERIRFSAKVLLSQSRGWQENGNSSVVLVVDDGKIEMEIFRSKIKENVTLCIDEQVDLTSFDEVAKLKVYWYDNQSGEAMDLFPYQCLMICPEVEVIK